MNNNGKYYPFHSGTQYADWKNGNCDRCDHYTDDPGDSVDNIICDIDRAISLAYFNDGSVSKEIAKRMGYLDNKGCFLWECPESSVPPEIKEMWKRWRDKHATS